MGIFSSICSGISSIVSRIPTPPIIDTIKTIGKAAKWVGKKLGLIEDEVADSAPVTENSSAREIDRMQDILQSYSRTYKKHAEEIEEACIELVDQYFTYLLNEIKKNDDIQRNIGLNNLEKNQRKLRREIEGTITDVVAKRISLDDDECRRIIALQQSDSKSIRVKVFCEDVLKEARNELSKKVTKILDEQTDEINSFLEDYSSENLNAIKRSFSEFKKWERDFENDTFDKERAVVIPLYKLKIFDDIEKKLGE